MHVVGDGHADGVVQAAARAGQPGQELVGAAAGVGADQHPPPRSAGQLRQREPGHLDVLGRGVRPGVPGAQHDGQRLPARPGAVVGERGERDGTRTSSSRSERLSPSPSARARSWRRCPPGSGSRPRQARGRRPAPRPAPGPRRGPCGSPAAPAARPRPARLTSREITGSEATGPASSGWARSTATSARQSPPSASVMTRSAMIFPGSCTARGARHRASPPDRPWPRPVTRAASASSNTPAWDTSPCPVSGHGDLGAARGILHLESAFGWRGQDPRQALSSQAKGTFYM